jgi:hypothetical protein
MFSQVAGWKLALNGSKGLGYCTIKGNNATIKSRAIGIDTRNT